MRRSAIISMLLSILFFGPIAATPSYATSSANSSDPNNASVVLNRPSQAELRTAVNRIISFADYSKYYGANATTKLPANHPHYAEYQYLHTLATKTETLIEHYDDIDFVKRLLPGTYDTALAAIDEALIGCSYLFGIVREQNAAQATQITPPSVATPSVAPQPSAPSANPTSITLATTSSSSAAPASPVESSSSASSNSSASASSTDDNTPTPTNNPTSTPDDNTPVAIPNTGGTNPRSSLIFIVIVALITALAATGIYYIYNRPTTHHKPSLHKKRY